MARYSGAIWRGPTPNKTPSGMISHIGLVLHIQQGTEAGTDSWFKNPAAQVSAHFGNPKTGQLEQWVDTDDRAWAEVAGNPYWVSVENEGNSGDTLTPSQFENLAELLAWLHSTYSVPLQSIDNPGAGIGGLTGHGLGGAAWGGHTDCPGRPILDARPLIIARAAHIAGAPTPGGNPVATVPPSIAHHFPGLDLSNDFTAGAAFTAEEAAIWADARAEAAYRQAVDNGRKLDQLLARAAFDVDALAAALAPKIEAGAAAGMPAQALADLCAHTAVLHLADALKAGGA